MKNSDSTLVTENKDILEKWKDYFGQLLNCEDLIETFMWTVVALNKCEYPPPSKVEIVHQIHRLKSFKAPAEDSIQSEIKKNLDEDIVSEIHTLIKRIWSEELLPKGWGVVLVCSIHKKNDPHNYNSYRGIALLNIEYKILSYCILDRIKPISKEILGEYQGGFRPNRSTTGQIFIVRQIFEKIWEFSKNVYVLFIDFKKAYDSIHRPSLFNIMKEFKFPQKLINLTIASLKNAEIKVKIANLTSPSVRVTTRLK